MIRTRNVLLASLILMDGLSVAPDAAGAAQGTGNPVLTVSPNTVLPGRSATLTVTGTDYLVPPHAPGLSVFGGVYVLFGWVRPNGAWGPSARNSNDNTGVFGVTYSYRGDGGDASTRDDGSGTARLVSFTAGGESGSATDFHMDDNGNWTTTLNIPSPTYQYQDVNGVKRTLDCRKVRCGVFTIGAHGKSSSTNERFTPVTFAAPPPTPTSQPASQGGTTPTTKPRVTPTTEPAGGGEPITPEPTVPGAPGPTTATTPVTGTGSTTVTKPASSTTVRKGTTTTKRTTSTTAAAAASPQKSTEGGEPLDAKAASSVATDDGSAAPWIVGGLVLLVAIGAAAGLWIRRRSAANVPN